MISAEKLQYPCLMQNKNISSVMLKVKCSYQLSCFYDRGNLQFANIELGRCDGMWEKEAAWGCLVMMSVRSLQKGQRIESVALHRVWNNAQWSGFHKTLTTKSIFIAADGMSAMHLHKTLVYCFGCSGEVYFKKRSRGWVVHAYASPYDGLL